MHSWRYGEVSVLMGESHRFYVLCQTGNRGSRQYRHTTVTPTYQFPVVTWKRDHFQFVLMIQAALPLLQPKHCYNISLKTRFLWIERVLHTVNKTRTRQEQDKNQRMRKYRHILLKNKNHDFKTIEWWNFRETDRKLSKIPFHMKSRA